MQREAVHDASFGAHYNSVILLFTYPSVHYSQCVEVDATNKTVVVNKPSLNKRPVSRIGIEDFGELVRSDPNVIQSFTFDLVLSSRYIL